MYSQWRASSDPAIEGVESVMRSSRTRGFKKTAALTGVVLALAATHVAYAEGDEASEGMRTPAANIESLSVDKLLQDAQDVNGKPLTSAGSFLLLSSVTGSAQYNADLSASRSAPKDGMVYAIRPMLQAKSQWSRHSLELYVGGEGRLYQDYSSDTQLNGEVGANSVIDIYHDLHLLTGIHYINTHEERGFGDSLVAYSKPINKEALDANAYIYKQFNRLWVQFGGSITNNSYGNALLPTPDGSLTVNEGFRSGDIYKAEVQSGYQLTDKTSLFVENTYNWRKYAYQAYDSSGYTIIGGVKHDFSSFLQGLAAAGWMHEEFPSAERTNIDTYTYRGEMKWKPTSLVTVTVLGNRRLGEPSSFYGGSSRVNTEAGLRIDYLLLNNVILSGMARYDWIDLVDVNRIDDVVRMRGSAIYNITQKASLSLSYTHEECISGPPTANIDYGRDTITAGVIARY
jgi:hypothetical protein